MSYNEKKYIKDILPRFRNWDELNSTQDAAGISEPYRQKPMTAENDVFSRLTYLSRQFNFDNLGWTPGPDGIIENDANGNSRLYIIMPQDDGTDTLVPCNGKEPSIQSYEFWDLVQRGNVLAFPAGDTKPVQLQMIFQSSNAELSFSSPLEPGTIPDSNAPASPKLPNVFKRAIHRIFSFAFRAEFEQYARDKSIVDKWNTSRSTVKNTLAKISSDREKLIGQEKAVVQETVRQKAVEAENKRLLHNMNEAQIKANIVDSVMETAKCAWEPEPKIFEDETTKKLYPGRTVKEKKGGVYDVLYSRMEINSKTGEPFRTYGYFTADAFGKLKPIGRDQLDLNSVKIGKSGKSLDAYDFTALALAATAVPRIGIRGIPFTSNKDTTVIDQLNNLTYVYEDEKTGKKTEKKPFSEDEALLLATDFPSMHYTTDVIAKNPRDGVGTSFAEPVMEPARQLTAKALNDYKAGDPTALGEIISHGIRQVSSVIAAKDSIPGESYKGQMIYAGRLVEMLDADPALKQAAINAGMQETDMLNVRGNAEAVKLDILGTKANVKFAEAAANGTDLPEESKKAALRDMIVGKIAIQSFVRENRLKPCPEYDEFMDKAFKNAYGMTDKEKNVIEQNRNNGKLDTPPPKGRMYMHNVIPISDYIKGNKRERPAASILLNSPTYRSNLEKVADQIIKEDNLMEKSPDQIVKKIGYLKSNNSFELGDRAMANLTKNGLLDEESRKQMAEEIKDPSIAKKTQVHEQAPEQTLLVNSAIEHMDVPKASERGSGEVHMTL